MKNISVTMLILLFMLITTNAEAQTRNKDSKRPSKTVQKKVVQKRQFVKPLRLAEQ